jgi:hypothetical protein
LWDYPGSATDHGSVRVQVVIGTDGHPTKCTVIRATSIASLDSATCPLVMQSGLFTAGTDDSGKPVEDTTELTVHYVVPHVQQTAADLPIGPHDPVMIDHPAREEVAKKYGNRGPGQAKPAQRISESGSLQISSDDLQRARSGQVAVLVDVGTDGNPAGCSVIRTSGSRSVDNAACTYVLGHLKYRPGIDYFGNPIMDEDLWKVDWATPH